jgi:hypothetical protein
MSSSPKIWEENPLRKLAETTLNKPGMYLIALRAHLNKGRSMIGDMLDSVAESLPRTGRVQSGEE